VTKVLPGSPATWQPGIEARVWKGAMPVQFLYTAGAAGERFFQTLKRKGVFLVTRCEECALTYLPPRIYCERCFADLSETWREVAPVGSVHSHTLVHIDREGHDLPSPTLVAFVRIDGTDGGFVTRLLDVITADVRMDMPVEVVLARRRKRRGTLDDIIGFRPARHKRKGAQDSRR
jgi:uncharacterized OB-fold protein